MVVAKYRCPFCETSRKPVWKGYRTLAGNLVFAGIFLLGIAVILSIGRDLLLTADEGSLRPWAIIVVGAAVFVGILWAVDHGCRSKYQTCPECETRIG